MLDLNYENLNNFSHRHYDLMRWLVLFIFCFFYYFYCYRTDGVIDTVSYCIIKFLHLKVVTVTCYKKMFSKLLKSQIYFYVDYHQVIKTHRKWKRFSHANTVNLHNIEKQFIKSNSHYIGTNKPNVINYHKNNKC